MASVVTKAWKGKLLTRGYTDGHGLTAPSRFKVGIDQTTAEDTDTDLDHPIPISGTEQVDSCDAITGWTDSADMTISVNSSTYLEGTGALNLTKDGSASATASTSKTVTSLDFTSKTLSVRVRINSTALALMATTDCITIRYGSDSSNYYQWTKDKTDMVQDSFAVFDGLDSSNADSTTGSPVETAMDYFYIAVTATASGDTWSAGDLIMDDILIASSDDYFKNFTSGYPSVDEDTLMVTLRGELLSTEANGYNVDGWAAFNTDGTAVLEGIDDFTDESKTATDEIIIVAKNRLI